MKNYTLAAVVIAAMLAGSGCASFKANNLPTVTRDQMSVSNTERVNVFSRWSVVSNNTRMNTDMRAAAAAVHKNHFDRALNSSNCCTLVESPAEADVIVEGQAVDHFNQAAMIPAFITGLSLYTIPSWATGKMEIRATATSTANTSETRYNLSDSMTMVQWLPMIFVMPFTGSPLTTAKELDENVYRNLVLRLKNDGLLGNTN